MRKLQPQSLALNAPRIRFRRARILYILPSHYDDDGYPLRFWKGLLPSNTLNCLRTLTQTLIDSGAFGEAYQITVETRDEFVQRISVRNLARQSRRRGEKLIVGLAGVQSNMFARAVDLAAAFRAEGIPVLIGGFHVSGCLKLFESPTPELQTLLDLGATLIQGEVESPEILKTILYDALQDRLQPVYRIAGAPDLCPAPVPKPNPEYGRHFMQPMGTIDTSRGCPFNCSFCTIINVQGHRMRHRSPESVLHRIAENIQHGFNTYFFTDDNLSRSPIWERLFDGMIAMRQRKQAVRFMMQVDTQSWRVPRFVEKAAAAGCYLVFIGMETLNPENLETTGKKQNKVDEYADMVQFWRRAGILVHVGYIIGLPHDSEESIRHDIQVLKDWVRVDEASFFMFTPLPGSKDHHKMIQTGIPIDADLNNLDSAHETFRHPHLLPGRWRAVYDEAWDSFYNKENLINILLRTSPQQYWNLFWLSVWNRYATLFRHHPMSMGFIRFKGRKDRRPVFPQESFAAYAQRRVRDMRRHVRIIACLFFEFQEIWLLTRKKEDPRWAALADLRLRWTEIQKRLVDNRLAERYDVAAKETREWLRAAGQHLERLSISSRTFSGRVRRRLHSKAQEVENYLHSLEVQPAGRAQLASLEQFIRLRLVAGYEETAIRYVAQRRRLNQWRREFSERLKQGRFSWRNWAVLPRAVVFELLLGIRFSVASIRMH